MTRSLSPRLYPLTLALAVAAGAAASLTGCAGQGDIDRTQPDKVDKAIFFDKATGNAKTYYFRQTTIGVPPTTNWTFEGMQTDLQKVRFTITEKFLIGYRAYDYLPGSQNDFTGGTNNTDTPLLMFAIKSHFDVKREYNPATGEQTNVISENTTDRPWDQRQYMRVDWSHNATVDIATTLVQQTNWTSGQTDSKNPDFVDRPIVTDGFIDFVNREVHTPDYQTCNDFWSAPDDGGPWGCGEAELKIRYSLMAVKPSTYEPLEYPDNYPLLDSKGNQIQLLQGNFPCSTAIQQSAGQYSGADCGPASVPGFSKFGFFRTVRQGYDRKYGSTELGRKYYANRWNIWEDSVARDADGNPVMENGQPKALKYSERTAKPIVYYTNVEFPDDPALFDQAKQVTADWSDALKKTVAGLLATEPHPDQTATPDVVNGLATKQKEMVELRRNSCNLTDFTALLKKYGDLEKAVKEATGQGADNLDKTHLMHACSVVEAATEQLKDGDPKKFVWQRNGDLRFSFFHWVDRPQPGGPLGYGPSSADPETGEIISASLYAYGAALDTYAQTSADSVDLLNSKISTDDLLSGKTIADVLKQTAQARQASNAQGLTQEAKDMATTLLRRGSTTTSNPSASRLIPVPTDATSSKLDLLKGTAIEQQMATNDILAAIGTTLPSAADGAVSKDQVAKVSPIDWLSDKTRKSRMERFQRLAQNGCIYMADFADDAILGLALKLKAKGLSGDALFKELRTLIFRGLTDHEMGHTMGLRHNFSGSNDALNYADKFWEIRAKMPKDQWDANQLAEYQYSTVMDYGSRFNSDVNGLGKYDLAAIRFGYGQLIDVMPSGAVNPTTGDPETGDNLRYHAFLNDYTKLPSEVGGYQNLTDGGVMRYSSIISGLEKAYTDPKYKGGAFLTPERPYKFCSDEYVGNLDCKPWDFGANQQEIVDDTIDRYKNYYFFQAFKRGRLSWTLDGYLNRLLERYYARYTEAFQFYYFYGDAYAGTDFANDLLKASVDSLNALGEVLQTPEPGMHCTTSISPDVMVLPDPSGPNACVSGQPTMNIDLPDGKPYYIDFSDDYYYRITRAGSLYEKLGALIALTSTQAKFYRVDTFADSNNYSINYYRLFKDEMLNLIGGVIRNDAHAYGGFVNGGNYQSTPVVDLSMWGKAMFDMPPYMQPNAKRVDTPVNKTIRYYALALSLANLNSTWDSTLDISNYMAVSVKGSNDDQTYDPSTTTVHEFTHPQTGAVYRAPQFDARTGIGVQLIDELKTLTGTKGTPGTLPEKYGVFNGKPVADWYTAKAALDAAKGGDQKTYADALTVFQNVDYLVAYRVDLLDDLRSFKRAFGY